MIYQLVMVIVFVVGVVYFIYKEEFPSGEYMNIARNENLALLAFILAILAVAWPVTIVFCCLFGLVKIAAKGKLYLAEHRAEARRKTENLEA